MTNLYDQDNEHDFWESRPARITGWAVIAFGVLFLVLALWVVTGVASKP